MSQIQLKYSIHPRVIGQTLEQTPAPEDSIQTLLPSDSDSKFSFNSPSSKYYIFRPSVAKSEPPPTAGNQADVQLQILTAMQELAAGMHTMSGAIQGMRQQHNQVGPTNINPSPDQLYSESYSLDQIMPGHAADSGHSALLDMLAESEFNPGPPVNDTDYLVPHWRFPADSAAFPGLVIDAEPTPAPGVQQHHANNYIYISNMTLRPPSPNPADDLVAGATADFVEGSSGGNTGRETEDQWEKFFPDEL